MPNWCSGNIRFRGKMNDILKLLRENVVFCRIGDNRETESKPANVNYDDDYNEIRIESPFEEGNKGWCYIENTHRNFLDIFKCESEIISSGSYIPDENEDEDCWIFIFEGFSAAWSIEPEPYMEMSKKYNVDIKIFGWERGVGFDQEIEIISGTLVKNHCSESKNYADWMWNTVLPYMGG